MLSYKSVSLILGLSLLPLVVRTTSCSNKRAKLSRKLVTSTSISLRRGKLLTFPEPGSVKQSVVVHIKWPLNLEGRVWRERGQDVQNIRHRLTGAPLPQRHAPFSISHSFQKSHEVKFPTVIRCVAVGQIVGDFLRKEPPNLMTREQLPQLHILHSSTGSFSQSFVSNCRKLRYKPRIITRCQWRIMATTHGNCMRHRWLTCKTWLRKKSLLRKYLSRN